MPLSEQGAAGSKNYFGAAILNRDTHRPLTVAINNERASPLLHGEINCIQKFYTVDYADASSRPSTADCIFLTSHEPCSLCLSGIAWAGFREFYYLFSYEDTRDAFAIPHDIRILEQVFRVRAESETDEQLAKRPLYNQDNDFFRGRSFADLVEGLAYEAEKEKWRIEIRRVKAMYDRIGEKYQKGKEDGVTTASVWK